MPRRKPPKAGVRSGTRDAQRTYYVAAEYNDTVDRLLVVDQDTIELYSVDLELAQHWYAAAWRGDRFDVTPFIDRRISGEVDTDEATNVIESGLVLAQCLRHGEGKPIVETYNGHPVYGSGLDVLISEVFEAALGGLIEDVTGIAGLTISPMHTGYALFEGRNVGKASIETVASSVSVDKPDLVRHAAPDGTVTILFSDIENSTEINERLGDQKWMEILREHNEIIRREKAIHRGFEVKTIGDAFMLAFQGIRDALSCAIAIQRSIEARNAKASDPISVRIGLHTGELIRQQDDFYGRHVAYAARVGAKARGKEILVSSLLRELVEPSGIYSFNKRQPVLLKGFRGRHYLHKLRWQKQ